MMLLLDRRVASLANTKLRLKADSADPYVLTGIASTGKPCNEQRPSIRPAEIQARQGPISVLEPLLLLQGHESVKSGWTSFFVSSARSDMQPGDGIQV